MTPDVVKVRAFPEYMIEAEFADGEVRRFDMKQYLNYPAFALLEDRSFFMRAHVANGAVTWTNDIDLSPDTLYMRGERVKRSLP